VEGLRPFLSFMMLFTAVPRHRRARHMCSSTEERKASIGRGVKVNALLCTNGKRKNFRAD
jgi:hypothetical protein